MLLFRSMNTQYCKLCLCIRTLTGTHTQSAPCSDIAAWPWYTAHSASPHCNSELQLIRAHALFLAAAQPRCAALGGNQSTSVIWLSPPSPGFSSGSQGGAGFPANFTYFHTLLSDMGEIGSLQMLLNWEETDHRHKEFSLLNYWENGKDFSMLSCVVECSVHTRVAGLGSNQHMHDLFWNGAEFSIILLTLKSHMVAGKTPTMGSLWTKNYCLWDFGPRILLGFCGSRQKW